MDVQEFREKATQVLKDFSLDSGLPSKDFPDEFRERVALECTMAEDVYKQLSKLLSEETQ